MSMEQLREQLSAIEDDFWLGCNKSYLVPKSPEELATTATWWTLYNTYVKLHENENVRSGVSAG